MNTEAIRQFRTTLGRRAVWGPFSKSADPAVVEAIGHAGADFIILDMEHGPCSLRDLEHLIRAAELAGVLPIVRVPEQGWQMVGAALDLGAGGVQMPQVRSADDARAMTNAHRHRIQVWPYWPALASVPGDLRKVLLAVSAEAFEPPQDDPHEPTADMLQEMLA